jgi:futalosine hydrolase
VSAPADLLLACATAGEGAAIAAALAPAGRARPPDGASAGATVLPATDVAGKTVVEGHLAGKPCRLVFTGIGPVNTAQALTALIERRRPALVLQFGIAGAYVPSGLPVGALAVASEEIYGDLGVLAPDGWHPADLIGIPVVPGGVDLPPRYNRFPLHGPLVRQALRLLDGAAPAVGHGPFLTLSQVTGVRAVGDALYQRTGALCESMEGAAAAHTCALYRVPFLEIRGISNLVEDRDRERWQIGPAVAVAQQGVRRLVPAILQE